MADDLFPVLARFHREVGLLGHDRGYGVVR